MTTSTLHLNNPVPSNGAVVSSLGGRHTVTVTLAGVGAISCVVQAWGSEQGTDSRKIGAPVTVSGTTTVSQTLTFDADCKQFWLELVKLSPACKFNATVENDGSTSFAGPVRAPQVIEPYGIPAKRLGRPVRIATFGPSTTVHSPDMGRCDVENQYVAFPATGVTTMRQVNAHYNPLLYYRNCLAVADGGVASERIVDFLARITATFSAGRKAPQDVVKKRPDVVFCYGGLNNNAAVVDADTTDATILELCDQWMWFVRYFTTRGIPVIDGLCHGSNSVSAGANLPYIRRAILMINERLLQIKAEGKDPLWRPRRIPAMVNADGSVNAALVSDGVHQNAFGGAAIAAEMAPEFDYLFGTDYPMADGQIYDDMPAVFGASAGVDPSGYYPDRTGGTEGARVCTLNEWRRPLTVSNATNSISTRVYLGNKFIAAGVAAQDNLVVDYSFDILDADGNFIDFVATDYIRVVLCDVTDPTKKVEYRTLESFVVAGRARKSFHFAAPAAAAGLSGGANSYLLIGVINLPIGQYTIVIHPLRYRRITPGYALP